MRPSISWGSLQCSLESSPNILKHNKNPLNKGLISNLMVCSMGIEPTTF